MNPGDLQYLPREAQAVVAAALGLIFGSFANVCIHRLPERRSVVWPGSSCPRCAAPIAWFDNLPVLSWLLLRGRCRRCRAPIPALYPLVEALCGALVVGLWAQHGMTWRWAALSYLAVSIVVLVPIDWRHGILPDRVTLTGIAAGLALSFLAEPGPLGAARGALVGALIPLGIRSLYKAWAAARERWGGAAAPPPATIPEEATFPESVPVAGPEDTSLPDGPGAEADPHREGMGLGDVKMLAMAGAFLGGPGILLTMLLGSTLGALYVIPLLATGRHTMKTPVPFGPFLGIGALISAFWGERLIAWYLGLVVI
jgi:leader peptidase (prepilin peptidase)/N-methyltransferase